ncbi:hypothetical protein ACFYU8_17720 [Brevibacillus sp. NPDC003359]|uniref:hypothetical protein n=1 Tax=unclassified Brevibacillus TaxID=2684853 RepID=UPI0036BC7587
MKKLIIVSLIAFVSAGCSPFEGAMKEMEKAEQTIVDSRKQSPHDGKFTTEYLGGGAGGWILTDAETGCQYIALNNSTPYTPRLNSKGVPMCKDTK